MLQGWSERIKSALRRVLPEPRLAPEHANSVPSVVTDAGKAAWLLGYFESQAYGEDRQLPRGTITHAAAMYGTSVPYASQVAKRAGFRVAPRRA